MLRIFVKDGRDLPAYSPADAVNLRARGWVEKTYDNGGVMPSGGTAVRNDTGAAMTVVPAVAVEGYGAGLVADLNAGPPAASPERAEEKPRRHKSDSSEES